MSERNNVVPFKTVVKARPTHAVLEIVDWDARANPSDFVLFDGIAPRGLLAAMQELVTRFNATRGAQ